MLVAEQKAKVLCAKKLRAVLDAAKKRRGSLQKHAKQMTDAQIARAEKREEVDARKKKVEKEKRKKDEEREQRKHDREAKKVLTLSQP